MNSSVITEIKQKCLELLFSVRSHITPSFEILAHWRSFKIAEVKKKKTDYQTTSCQLSRSGIILCLTLRSDLKLA